MSVCVINADVIDGLKQIDAGSVNTCITSPPYWGLRDYGTEGQIGLESTPGEYVDRIVDVFRGVRRVLRDDGTIWVNLGDSYAAQRGATSMPAETLAGGDGGQDPGDGSARRGRTEGKQAHRDARSIGLKHKDLVGIPWRVAFALQADGWYLRSDIIWAKPNPMPESVTDRPTKAHEYIFLLAKLAKYYYDADAISERSSWDGTSGNKNFRPGLCMIDRGMNSGEVTGTRNRRTVWTVPTTPYKGAHFAVFPPDLIRPCVLAGSPRGGTVLDPFAGSGTTGEVSEAAGRNSILVEINSEYCELIRKRTRQKGLFAD